MAYERRDLVGGAVKTTLSANLTSGGTSFTIAATTGWPSGTNGDFFVVIGRGTATEEKLRCTGRTGSTVSVPLANRGADGTSATAHSSGDDVEICGTALDDDEANYAVAQTVGKVTAAGQLLISSGANAFASLDAKTSGQILVGNGTTLVSVAVSGDATLSAAGALTIGAAKVGIAKMSVTATDRLLGRDTAGAGAAEELTVGGGLEFTGSGGIQRSALTGDVTASAGSGATTIAAGVLPVVVPFMRAGTLTTGVGTLAFRAPFAMTLQHVRLYATTAPTGAAILVDVNKNGTTMFTTQANRPTIAISANSETATTAPDVTAVAAGDRITIDVDQVGSTVAGADLSVILYFTKG